MWNCFHLFPLFSSFIIVIIIAFFVFTVYEQQYTIYCRSYGRTITLRYQYRFRVSIKVLSVLLSRNIENYSRAATVRRSPYRVQHFFFFHYTYTHIYIHIYFIEIKLYSSFTIDVHLFYCTNRHYSAKIRFAISLFARVLRLWFHKVSSLYITCRPYKFPEKSSGFCCSLVQ